MKSYLFLLFTLLLNSAFATHYSYSVTFYGCPDECESQEDPKCERGIPSNNLFVAMPPQYFEEKEDGNFKYCDKYAIVMPLNYEKAVGSYKIVKGKVIDQCGSCGDTQIDLSQTLFEKIAKASTGVIDTVWTIISKDGKIYVDNKYDSDKLSNLSKATGVSSSEIIESYNEVAKYMATNDIDTIKEWPWEYLKNHGSLSSSSKKTTTIKTTTTKKSATTTTKKSSNIVKSSATSGYSTKCFNTLKDRKWWSVTQGQLIDEKKLKDFCKRDDCKEAFDGDYDDCTRFTYWRKCKDTIKKYFLDKEDENFSIDEKDIGIKICWK